MRTVASLLQEAAHELELARSERDNFEVSYERQKCNTMAFMREKEALQKAMLDLLDWRGAVNQNAAALIAGMGDDTEVIAVALFNGPVWDAAMAACND